MKRKITYFKKSFFTYLFLATIFVVVGCGNKSEEKYNSAIQKGLDNLAAENYEKATVSFEVALEEKPDDKRAKALLSQTESFDLALESLEDGKLEVAAENAESVKKTKNGSEALIKKSSDILNNIEQINSLKISYQETYNAANTLFKEGKYTESLEQVNKLLEDKTLGESYYLSIKELSEELKLANNKELDNIAATEEILESEAQAKAESEANQHSPNENTNPYEWGPGIYEEFINNMISQEYITSEDDIINFVEQGVYDEEGVLGVYIVGWDAPYPFVNVNVKTGDFHG